MKSKKLSAIVLISLFIAAVLLIIPASQIQAGVNFTNSQLNLQEDLLKYKYPYSELPATSRIALVNYEINMLNEQNANFQPCQGITLSYIRNSIAHLQTLLPISATTNLPLPSVSTYPASSVTAPVAINMIYYGSNSNGVEQNIINAHPEFLVDNSPAGPEKGDADVAEYEAAGIKYFEYLDGGYEGTVQRTITNDLQSNLNYITAAANTGAYGIFLDEVSDYPNAVSLSYLKQIYNKAHSFGLKVVFNTGEPNWSSELMKYCDYMNSSETWQDNLLTKSQNEYGNRVWLETQRVTDANSAVKLTENAWEGGIEAECACDEYIALPDWLDNYVAQIRSYQVVDLSFVMYVAGGIAVMSAVVLLSARICHKRR